MFGEPLGKLTINGFSVETRDVGENLRLYVRRSVDEGKERVLVKKMVSRNVELVVYPMYPIYYPRFVTRHILCILEEELVLAPRDSKKFYLKFPYDIAVYAEMKGEFRVLDIIPLHSKYKLAFYGHQAGGIIARTCRSRVYIREPGFSIGQGVMPVHVVNETSRVVVLSKVLLDSSPLKLYYEPGSWRVYTQVIQINISTQNVAVVTYGDPPREGMNPIDDPPEIRPPKIVGTTYMLWGF